MAIKGRGALSRLAYIKETTKGTAPTSGTLYEVQQNGETFDYNIEREYDSDITSDGQHRGTVSGLAQVQGGFSFQLSHQSLEDFIPALCGRSGWTTNTVSLTGEITVSDGIGTFTASDTPDLSGVVAGVVGTIAGTSNNNDDWMILSVNTGSYTFTFKAFRDGQSDPAAEAGLSSDSLTQVYCHTGGQNFDTFTVEKHLGVPGSDDSFILFRGQQPDSLTLSMPAGGGVTGTINFLGLGQTVQDSGILAPTGYTVHADGDGNSDLGAADDTVVVNGTGSNNFAVGQKFWFDGNEIERSVVSIATPATYAFKFTPAIETGTTIASATAVYCGSVATVRGETQKFENNLGYIRIDGVDVCVQGVDLTVSNAGAHTHCVGSSAPDSNEVGDRQVTATLNYYVSEAEINLMKKVRAGTVFPVFATSIDRSNNVFGFVIHDADSSQTEAQISTQGVLSHSIAVKAIRDATTGAYVTFYRA